MKTGIKCKFAGGNAVLPFDPVFWRFLLGEALVEDEPGGLVVWDMLGGGDNINILIRIIGF